MHVWREAFFFNRPVNLRKLLLSHSGLGGVAFNRVGGRRQSRELLDGLFGATEHWAGALKVSVDVTLKQVLLAVDVDLAVLVGELAGDAGLPFDTVVFQLLLVVEVGVVVLADAAEAFPERQVLGVDGDTMIIILTALADVPPTTLLLLQVETSGVGKEEESDDHAGKTEPWDNVETLLDGGVRTQDGSNQSTQLTPSSRHTVGTGTDGSRVAFSSDNESNTIGAELVEEGRQEVHGLERVNVFGRSVVLVVEARDNEEDEAHEETHLLHPLTAVQLVVDKERGSVVSAQGDTNVEQTVQPVGHDGLLVGQDDGNELRLEQLVSVEENIVGEPAGRSSKETEAKMLEGHAQRLNIVTSNRGLLLDGLELLGGRLHVVGTVVGEPESTGSGNSERNTIGPLSRELRVGGLAGTAVEDKEEQDQEDLVKELTPTLHEESAGDLAATVKAIIAGRNATGTDSVLHTGSGSHGVFTTDTDTVEEERPGVANDPAVLGDTPSSSQHQQTDKHDGGILDQTPATTDPKTISVNYHLCVRGWLTCHPSNRRESDQR